MWGMRGEHPPTAEQHESLAGPIKQCWLTLRNFPSSTRRAVVVPWGLCSGTLREAGRQVQPWGSILWWWARFSSCKTQSYPTVTLLPVTYAHHTAMCQAKQYVGTRCSIQKQVQAESHETCGLTHTGGWDDTHAVLRSSQCFLLIFRR